MSDLHLNDLTDLVNLLVVQILLHDERLVALGVNVAVPEEKEESPLPAVPLPC